MTLNVAKRAFRPLAFKELPARRAVAEPFAPSRVRKVAYFVNQYPKVTHTFIRREIHAVERCGIEVNRFALHGWDADVVDESDKQEQAKTSYILEGGLRPLMGSAFRVFRERPGKFFGALGAAFKMSRKSIRPLPYHLVYLAHACRMLELLKDDPVDHLHAHFGTNTADVAYLLRLLGGPSYSFTVHGADEVDNATNLNFDRKVGDALFTAAVSHYNRSQLLRHIDPADWSKVKVVHCGLPDHAFADVPAPLPETPTFLCIGRFSVVSFFPEAKLVLAGDGPLRPQVQRRIDDLGLRDNIRLTGWLDAMQVREEILKSHVLVQPSFQEGLPVVIMEAMAQQRTIISTYVAGIPELVRNGETGWLVPAGDKDQLVEAMISSIEAPKSQLIEMGQRAGLRAWDRHSVDHEAAKLAKFMDEMV